MTKQEALVFLSVNEDDEIITAYEDRIFEFKKDFTSKVLIPSVLQKKIDKLKKLDEAAEVLGLELNKSGSPNRLQYSFSSNILESYIEFEKINSQFKLEIYRSTSANDLISLVDEFLKIFQEYLKLWPSFVQFQKTAILAKQPDPMDLLADIKYAHESGIGTFNELANDLTEHFPLLKNESTRLNKLFNMSL